MNSSNTNYSAFKVKSTAQIVTLCAIHSLAELVGRSQLHHAIRLEIF